MSIMERARTRGRMDPVILANLAITGEVMKNGWTFQTMIMSVFHQNGGKR